MNPGIEVLKRECKAVKSKLDTAREAWIRDPLNDSLLSQYNQAMGAALMASFVEGALGFDS